jgi:hypothetical protein
MTKIVINLKRGPDDQPTGQLTTGSGQIIPFTGWLNLIRVLEDELHQSPQPSSVDAGAGPPATSEAQ